MFAGTTAPAGSLGLVVTRSETPKAWPAHDLSLGEVFTHGMPRVGLPTAVNAWRTKNAANLWRGARRVFAARAMQVPTHYGALYLTLIRDGRKIPLGLASLRVVTDAGVAAIVDAFQNTVELENFKYHGFGTGTTAEAAGDTALVTELTTEYVVNSTRPTGTTTEGASANIYRTVATLSPDSGGTIAVTEHGVFSATSAGTLLDRSKFSAVNLVASSDSLQATYDLTFTSGS